MYSIDTIKNTIKLFYQLKKNNFKGYKIINFIKNSIGCHITTVYNWINQYGNFNFNNFNKSKFNNNKITEEIEKFILSSISNFNTFNIKKIKKNINNIFKVSLSKQSIYHVLHKNNLTYKQNKVKNMPYSDDKLLKLKSELKDKIKPVFNNLNSYDEMAIYLNDTPSRGWSIKGNDCIIKTKKSLNKKRYTIGMNIDINSDIDFTLIEGSLKQDKLINFFNKLNKNKIKNRSFLMDNASIHKSKKMIKYIKDNNLKVIYNIPYCSEYNPIEYIFSLLRKKLLNEEINNEKDIIKIIVKFKKEINKNHVKNIFNKCVSDI
jgi:transposase